MSDAETIAPRISIVIPTRNRQTAVRKCVQACLDLDFPRNDYEVLVIDDGSDLEVQPFDAENVRVIRQQGSGPAIARNRGIRAARGQWIAFTDDDCLPNPDWLRRFAETFVEYPEHLIGGLTVNALTGNPYSTASQLLVTFLYSHFDKQPRQRFFTSNNMAASRERLLAIGGFDESFPLPAAEDRDLCDRWIKNAGELRNVPEAVVNHEHRMNLRGFVRQQFQYGRGARVLSLRRKLRGMKFQVETGGFYRQLFSTPFHSWPVIEASWIFVLLFVSQLATVAGFAVESIDNPSSKRP